MTFRKMSKTEYPPRLWALVGYPGSGKSTFATQMCAPLLVIDADHRFQEVLDLAGDRDVYELSNKASDNTDSDRVAAILAENMPRSEIGTIVVDICIVLAAVLNEDPFLASFLGGLSLAARITSSIHAAKNARLPEVSLSPVVMPGDRRLVWGMAFRVDFR